MRLSLSCVFGVCLLGQPFPLLGVTAAAACLLYWICSDGSTMSLPLQGMLLQTALAWEPRHGTVTTTGPRRVASGEERTSHRGALSDTDGADGGGHPSLAVLLPVCAPTRFMD